jgi:hypothetical protein
MLMTNRRTSGFSGTLALVRAGTQNGLGSAVHVYPADP